jgi:hypothetical protein
MKPMGILVLLALLACAGLPPPTASHYVPDPQNYAATRQGGRPRFRLPL